MTKKIVLVVTDQNEDEDVRVDFGEGTSEDINVMDVFGAIAFLNNVVYDNVLESCGDEQTAFDHVKQLNELALKVIRNDTNQKKDKT